MKWSLSLLLGVACLAIGCQDVGNQEEKSAPSDSTFVRPNSSSYDFMGELGGLSVSMTAENKGEAFKGAFYFRDTGIERTFAGKLSYEGFFRIEAKAHPDNYALTRLPAKAKGIFLTHNHIVGTWQSPLHDQTEFISVTEKKGGVTLAKVEANNPQSLILSHWTRKVNCIAQNKDSTGVMVVDVPALTVNSHLPNWRGVYWSLVESLIFQPRCTCKALTKRGGGNLHRWVENPDMNDTTLRVELVETLNGKETQRKRLTISLETGELLP